MEEATEGRGEGKGRPHPERGAGHTGPKTGVSASDFPAHLSDGGDPATPAVFRWSRLNSRCQRSGPRAVPCRPTAAASSADLASTSTSTSTTATTPPPPSPPASPRPTAAGGAGLVRHTRRAAPARPAPARSRLPESVQATGRSRPRAPRGAEPAHSCLARRAWQPRRSPFYVCVSRPASRSTSEPHDALCSSVA